MKLFYPTTHAMKFCPRTFLLFLLMLSAAAHASTTAPMFAGSPGLTLTIQGEDYTWTSPAIEDATWHYDTYTNTTGQTVAVKGMISNANLATVSGSTSTGAVAGYLQNGAYGDNHQSSSSSGSWLISGVSYTDLAQDVTYQVDFTEGILQAIQTISDYTVSGDTPHLHRYNYWDSDNFFMDIHDTFTGGHAPFSGLNSGLQALGNTYAFSSSSSQFDDYYDADEITWTDSFTDSSNGSTLSIKGTRGNDSSPSFTVTVWHPNAGMLASNYVAGSSSSPYYFAPDTNLTGVTWLARPAPTLARAQLLLDGVLLNWQTGSIATDGTTIDNFGGGGVTLSIRAGLNDYFMQGNNATVTITSSGGGSGTLARDGTFNLTGHVLQYASLNRSEPLFTGDATLLKITYSSFFFAGGYEDSLGNRSDVYVNSSIGMIVLSGSTSDLSHGTVKVSKSGTLYTGTFNDYTDSFSVTGVNIIKSIVQPNVFGPPAFWARGEFYLRTASTALTYQSAAGKTITLGGNVDAPTLSGQDAEGGTFGGAFDREPLGVFLVQAVDVANQPIAPVPVLAANADGSLHLSWQGPGGDMPPAVRDQAGHILVYLGSAVEDTNSATSAAYYGCATVSDQTPWLMKLRTDGSGIATYTDYSTATSTTGSYNTTTHLFQTGAPGSGFPMPVYGVDPNANFALWGLTQPSAGLPATFMVRGQPWRLASYDSTSDTATYQGFYAGQQMSLAKADANGQRLVTLTDPVYNATAADPFQTTEGTLSNARDSVRLRDGTLALSGTDQGQQAAVQLPDDYKLQTIAADLDIVGNNISFGILQGDASVAGALFQFADDSSKASLHSILSRPLTEWLWWRTEDIDANTLRPVMQLDAGQRLKLYQPSDSTTPAIVLDPAGTSSFKGPVRVPQSGDIPMGAYQVGDPP
jgi:hypothetical protein